MLRIVVASVAAVIAIGLAGAPVASAGTCYGTGTVCSRDPKYKPNPPHVNKEYQKQRDKLSKDIAKKIKGALGCD